MIAMSPNMERPLFLPQCAEQHNGNVCLVPDPRTLQEIPWAGGDKYRVSSLICETKWLPDYEPQPACPRYGMIVTHFYIHSFVDHESIEAGILKPWSLTAKSNSFPSRTSIKIV